MENTLKTELQLHGYNSSKQLDYGCILQSMTFEDVVYLNQHIHCAESVEIVLLEDEFTSLEELRDKINKFSLAEYFQDERTFGVRSLRKGRHEFNQVNLSQAVAAGISRAIVAEGIKPKANLKHPDLLFQSRLHDLHFLLSLNTTGDFQSDAASLPYQHQAPIKRSLAAGLLFNSNYNKSGFLFDPMCGGGTIALEAFYIQEQIAISSIRSTPFAYENHHYKQDHEIPKGRSKLEFPNGLEEVILGDSSRNKIRGAIENLAHYNMKERARFYRGNSIKMGYLAEDKAVPSIVVNPPYGIRVKNPKDVDDLYVDFAKKCFNIGAEEVMAITPRKRAWLQSFEDASYNIESITAVDFAGLPTSFIKAKRIN